MPLVELGPLHQGRDTTTQVFKLINEIRAQVNLLPNVFNSVIQTAGDGVATMIWGRAIEDNSAAKLTASVLGTTANLAESCAFTIECAVVNVAGVLSFVGVTQQVTFVRETVPGTDAAFAIAGTALLLNVTDAGAQQTYWRATVYAEEIG